jgi:hypothetical protein
VTVTAPLGVEVLSSSTRLSHKDMRLMPLVLRPGFLRAQPCVPKRVRDSVLDSIGYTRLFEQGPEIVVREAKFLAVRAVAEEVRFGLLRGQSVLLAL